MIRSAASAVTKVSAICSHVLALERSQHLGELAGAEVELLVEGVDLALAVDGVGTPLALGAAPPEPPVAPVPGLLPAGRLHQRRATARADVEPGGGAGLAVRVAFRML